MKEKIKTTRTSTGCKDTLKYSNQQFFRKINASIKDKCKTSGIGWGLLGYCPGTSLGALGEGRIDALWGIGGMLVGAGVYAEAYPYLQKTVLTWGDYGKITIPQVLGVNHWIIIVILLIAILGLFKWFEQKEL